VHELGHFLAAKRTGVKVEEFVLGFPPLIYKKQVGETLYGIGLIPFGGYNKILGEDVNDPNAVANPRSYESQKPLAKLLIISGGIIMNLILAVAIFYFLAASSGFQIWQSLLYSDYKFPVGQQQNFPMIARVVEGSPAQKAGIEAKDAVISSGDVSFSSAQGFMDFVSEKQGQTIPLNLKNTKTGQEKVVEVELGKDDGTKQALGVSLADTALISYKDPFEKISVGFLHSYNITHFSFATIGRIISSSFAEKDTSLLGISFVGPVGIYAATKIIIEQGWLEMVNLCGIVSLALATTNILPIPAFDGGKMVFIFLQAINKKRFTAILQYKIEQVGAFILIGLAVLITFKDFWVFKDIIFK
jgi:regulator of sigma E protease